MTAQVDKSNMEIGPIDNFESPLEKADQQSDFPEGGARAWAVALGCGGLLFGTFGFANAFGVFQEYYIQNQLSNHSASAISWIGSVQVFSLFAGGLFGGPMFDRFGAKIIWPAVIAYLLGVMMTSICKEYWQFMLAQGILAGMGMGMTISPGMAATGHYFQAKRAAALGIAVAGSSLGGVIFPIALSKMLNAPSTLSFGWTVRICGFIMMIILLPSSFAIRARLPPRKENFLLPSAFRSAPYVTLIAATFLLMLGVFQPIFYLPTYAVTQGHMRPELAFYLTAILNGASFFGRVIPGITADRFGRLNLLSFFGVCTGILCLCWPATRSNAAIIAFAAVYGFFSGAIVSLTSACQAQVPKDPRDIGTYMGMGMFCAAFAVLAGPPINGAMIDRYGGFEQASVFSGVVCIVGGVGTMGSKWTLGKGWWVKA
ncbi:MAG: hypothetical protein Q9160_006883 [Pyrenula sp. 1 TL-2023]